MNGGRGQADLNIVQVGITIHQSFHALFDALSPTAVCEKINGQFASESECLIAVPTKDFSTFYRYFSNRGILPKNGMASHGVTWGHLFLYGNQEDLQETFRGGKYYLSKAEPVQSFKVDRYLHLFGQVSMAVMAFELTKYWLPLSGVVVAISKQHEDEVRNFLQQIASPKKKR
jgi:hypothetical protein